MNLINFAVWLKVGDLDLSWQPFLHSGGDVSTPLMGWADLQRDREHTVAGVPIGRLCFLRMLQQGLLSTHTETGRSAQLSCKDKADGQAIGSFGC